ncbi:MAG: branched-chain amino acid ABC transporter permease [Betaproteobacteria bacterium]
MRIDRSSAWLAVAMVVLLAAGPFLPDWLRFLGMVALANALVVLGVMLLMRAGLVSFGQGLYYCIGGYAAGVAGRYWGVSDAFALLALGVVMSAAIAAVLGLLLARYREIFFAMFTMAFSMILFGLLSKTQALGSTDGFNVVHASFLGWRPGEGAFRPLLFSLTVVVAFGCAILLQRYLRAGMGYAGEAIRENEIRVEYLGISVQRVVYAKYVLAAVLGSLGGGLQALASGHVGPDMAYWTTSGEFVFVALLGGTAHVGAVLSASFLFELVKTYLLELSPYTWQLSLGVVLLGIILFLPKGLWSLLDRFARRPA